MATIVGSYQGGYSVEQLADGTYLAHNTPTQAGVMQWDGGANISVPDWGLTASLDPAGYIHWSNGALWSPLQPPAPLVTTNVPTTSVAPVVLATTYPYQVSPLLAADATATGTNMTTTPATTPQSFTDYVNTFLANLSPLELGLIAGGLLFAIVELTKGGNEGPYRRGR